MLRHQAVLGIIVILGCFCGALADVCTGNCTIAPDGTKICLFTTKVDFYASEWGYYSFEECGKQTNPTLGLEIGVTYIFNQADPSNYKHPLGFAYYADGAHAGVDELEPGIAPPNSSSSCGDNLTCPAPMYMLEGEYLGKYSNNDKIANATVGEDNFGLDDYEPLFFHPILDWAEMGTFAVALKVTEITNDIFYFCHIHALMSGRIKIIRADGLVVQREDEPEIPYEYDQPSDYDKECGTYNLEEYQLPHGMCPSAFVCDVPEDNPNLKHFSRCLESMDCAMVVGMTNGVSAESEIALFIHQMIPHHQNAVNMAKALLKTDTLNCEEFSSEEDDCVMEHILRDIITGQNHQIQQMRAILENNGYPETDQCVLEPTVSNGNASEEKHESESEGEGDHDLGVEAQNNVEAKAQPTICTGNCTTASDGTKTCIFTAKVDLYASEWGYYTFDECGKDTNPTLGLEMGATYIFNQADLSNYKHPLGFAYYADGAHAEVDELEPGIAPPGSGSSCSDNMTCPAPMYMLDGEYLGTYSNNEKITDVAVGDDNFGLDDYEPLFFRPISDWAELGTFEVALKVTDITKDFFYFCHIHALMSGRIKIVDADGVPVQSANEPEIPYEYDKPSDYDNECGTYNLEKYQLPHRMCPSAFVCDVPEVNPILMHFSNCLESMDCAMVVGMTNGVKAESETALFIHQMIPHHQNAVNMAKALLKTGTLICEEFASEEDDCVMEQILRDIITGQNHQIQQMRAILKSKGYPEKDQCVIEPITSDEHTFEQKPQSETQGEHVHEHEAEDNMNTKQTVNMKQRS